MAALPQGMAFEPLMTLYLTETNGPRRWSPPPNADGLITAVKLYPAGRHLPIRNRASATSIA